MRLNTDAVITVLVVKKLTVMIDDDLHKRLKVKAAKDSTSITEIVIKALEAVV